MNGWWIKVSSARRFGDIEGYILINAANRSPRFVNVHFLQIPYLPHGVNGPVMSSFSVHQYRWAKNSPREIIAQGNARNSYPYSKNCQIYPHDPSYPPVIIGGGFFRHSSVQWSKKIAQLGRLRVVFFFRRKIQKNMVFTTGTAYSFIGWSRQQGTFLFLKNTGFFNPNFNTCYIKYSCGTVIAQPRVLPICCEGINRDIWVRRTSQTGYRYLIMPKFLKFLERSNDHEKNDRTYGWTEPPHPTGSFS